MLSGDFAVLCLVAVCSCLLRHAVCVPEENFLPFATQHGDSRLQGASVTVPLPEHFTFLGETFSSVRVNSKGFLGWGQDTEKFIAPFSGDADITAGGSVLYRYTTDAALLQHVSDIINASFVSLGEGPIIHSLFIATWHQVPAVGGATNLHNTFQCILAYRGASDSEAAASFVVFLYEDGGIHWSKGAVDDSKHALVGFNGGNESLSISLPGSGTSAVVEVVRTGNTGAAGQWLFRVDRETVALPAPLVGLEETQYPPTDESVGTVPVCVLFWPGQEPSVVPVSVRLDGGREYDTTFDATEPSRKCVDVTIEDDAIVEATETLTLELSSSYGDHLALIPSTATIDILDNDLLYVSARPVEVNAREDGGFASLCFVVSGQVERNFNLGLLLHNGTAYAGVHYVNNSGVMTVPPIPFYCFVVYLVNDDIYNIGGTQFTASLYSADPAVEIDSRANEFHINIADDDASKVEVGFTKRVFVGSEADDSIEVCAELTTGRLGAEGQIDINITTHTVATPFGVPEATREDRDYVDAERIISFDSTTQDSELCLHVPILEDEILEDSESFIVEIRKMDSLGYNIRIPTVYVAIDDNEIVTATVESRTVIAVEREGSRAEVCIVVDQERAIDVKMRATPSPVNATVGDDYINTPVDFTLLKEENRACAEIRIRNDFMFEALYEQFNVDISSYHSRVLLDESRVAVLIEDSDKLRIRILESPVLANVGETEYCNYNATGQYCVIISGKIDIEVAILFHTADGTAVAEEDYVPFNLTKVFKPDEVVYNSNGDTQYCSSFCTTDDIIVEGVESFFVKVTPLTDRFRFIPSDKTKVTVTIQDNDVIRIFPTENELTVEEDEGHVSICVNMVGLTERPVNISIVTVDDTAIEGVDYVVGNKNIQFDSYLTTFGHLTSEQVAEFSVRPPLLRECVDITIVDDNVVEQVKSKVFVVKFDSSSAIRDRLVIESEVTVTINDNDRVQVAFASGEQTVGEGAQRARIQLALDGAADFPFTVSIQTHSTGGLTAAVADNDYSAVEDSVLLPAGYTLGNLLTNELTVPVRDDELLENTESFQVTLRVESGHEGVTVGSPSTMTIFIEDNDAVEVGLADAEFRVLEKTAFAPICCGLSGSLGKTVTVDLTSSPGTATEGEDYVAAPFQFVFPPSDDSQHTQCIQFQLLDDDVLESVESFFVTISTSVPRVTVGRDTATVSVVDDDGVYVSLLDSEVSVVEDGEGGSGGEVTMCVRMTGIIGREVNISLFTEPDTAHANTDYTSATRSIVFKLSNNANQTLCTNFTYLNDEVVEDTEQFFVNLTAMTQDKIDIVTNRAKVLITDSDRVSVDFENPSYSVTEGSDASVDVCVLLGARVEKKITVQFSSAADTAQHYSDFHQNTSQLVFESGGPTRMCVSIIVMDDSLLEDNEQFTAYILISDPALYIASDVTSINSSAVVVIGDNDHVSVSLERASVSVAEGVGQFPVCCVLSGVIGKPVPITFSTTPGTARAEFDYTTVVTEVTFEPSSEAEQTLCVDVPVINDAVLEDVETFHVAIGTEAPRVAVPLSTATVSVEDDDTVEVTMVTSMVGVLEDVESGELQVCLQRVGPTEKAVDVVVFAESGSATAGFDFSDSRYTVLFPASLDANHTVCVPIPILDDIIVEGVEEFFVRLTASDLFISITGNHTRVAIVDGDRVSVGFDRSVYTVSEEEEEKSVCVSLGGEVEREVTVGLTTSDASALSPSDFTQTNINITFQPRAPSILCAPIPIENDEILESEEYFSVALASLDPAVYTRDATSTATVTVTDDDSVKVSVVSEELMVEEDDELVVTCVELVGVIGRSVSVTLTTAADTAHADEDFVNATQFIEFRPLQSSVQQNCTYFSILNDDTVEETESFFVQLSADDPQLDIRSNSSRIIIDDMDVVDVGFVRSPQTVSEGDGQVEVCVDLSARVERAVTVILATDDGTAHQLVDYSKLFVELTFKSRGVTRMCVDVEIVDNAVLEHTEQFTVYVFGSDRTQVVDDGGVRGYVRIEEGSGGEEQLLSGGLPSVVVINDDDTVRIGLNQTVFSVNESQSDVEVCLVIEGETEISVDVTMETEGGTEAGDARASHDFFSTSRDVIFGPHSTKRSLCATVQLINDDIVEGEERFTVKLSSQLEGTALTLDPKVASIIIHDDDVVCLEDRTSSPRGDYTWEKTKPETIEQRCQHGDDGMAKRECDRNGEWGVVNLDECDATVEDLFTYLDQMPFSCMTFRELLRTVTQATENKNFEPEYLAIVARYFSDFAEITERDGYNVENNTCMGEDAFTMGVKIIDQLFEWPSQVLRLNSSSIILNFETVSEHMVNSKSANKKITLGYVGFSSFMVERESLEKDGTMREFSSTSKAGLEIYNETGKADKEVEILLGSIKLPPSLFETLEDEKLLNVGVWFSLHRTGDFFPQQENSTAEDAVATPIISATVGGQRVRNLTEPVTFLLRLLNQSVISTNCAAWNHDTEEWDTDGCKTEFVKDGYVNCSCTHLTNFAGVGEIVQGGTDGFKGPEPSLALSIVSLVGVMLAILALSLTLFELLVFGKLRRRRTTILRAQLCVSLLVLLLAYAGHIVIDYTTTFPQDIIAPCQIVSAITHYFTLTSIIWLGTETLLMFRKLIFDHRLGDVTNLFFVATSLTSWILPIPFAAIPGVLSREWTITEDEYCFISSVPVFFAAFLIPAGLMLLFDIVIFTVVVCVFVKFICKRAPDSKKKMKRSRRLATAHLILVTPTTTILFVLGWALAALTFLTSEASIGLHLLSAVFIAVLGWFIFIYYILTAKDTRKLVHDAFCKPKKQLNTQQFLSMESLGQASGIDESDSDSDYPEREKRYGEFDVTYIGRKAALIEQKFSIRFMSEGAKGGGERGEDSSGGDTAQPTNSRLQPSRTDEQPSTSTAEDTFQQHNLEAIAEEPEKVKLSENSGSDESPVKVGSYHSQEDVNSDEGSPKAAVSRKTFMPPSGQIVFTVTPET